MSAATWQPRSALDRQLTADRLLDGLYCCSPTGLVQLTQHLRERGLEFEGEALRRELDRLAAAQRIYARQVDLPGAGPVVLYSRPGHGI